MSEGGGTSILLNPKVKVMKSKYVVNRKKSNGFKFLCERKKSDSLRLNVNFDLTEQYLREIWNDYCPVLNIKLLSLDTKLSRSKPHDSAQLDRIVPSKGYVKGNVRFISFRANRLKDNGTLDEFKKIVKYLEEVVNE